MQSCHWTDLWAEGHRTVLVQNKEPIFGTHLTFTRPLKQGNVQLTSSACYRSQLFSERLHGPFSGAFLFCLWHNCSKQLLDFPCHSEETNFSLRELMCIIQQPRAEGDSAAKSHTRFCILRRFLGKQEHRALLYCWTRSKRPNTWPWCLKGLLLWN